MSGKTKSERAVIQRASNAKRKAGGRPFQKGNTIGFKPGDPRINRNGRPKDHDQLRALIQSLAADGVGAAERATRIEDMLRRMFASRSAADRQLILEHGWGKVPQDINLSVDDELRKLGVDPDAVERDLATVIAAGASTNDAAGGAESDATQPDA